MKAKMKLITKNNKPKRKVSNKRKLEQKCLVLWSQCVRARDMTCKQCNSDYKLSAHHIRSCTNLSTRYLLDNGICLCWKCHSLQKWNPEKFQDMVLEIIGDEKYQELKRKSQMEITKHTEYDLEMIIEYLEGALEDIKSGIPF
jgi:hypothetical protein